MTSGFSGRCATVWHTTPATCDRGQLHELDGKAARDAVAHEEELPDGEMVHQPELIIGERAQGSSTANGPEDSPPFALR